jgi:hypothetical protein
MLNQALAAAGRGSGGAPPTSTTPTQPTTPTTPGHDGHGQGHGRSGSGGAGLVPPGSGHGVRGNARANGHGKRRGDGFGQDAVRQLVGGMLD